MRLERGDVFLNARPLATVPLAAGDGRVLSVPQDATEAALRAVLRARAPSSLHLGMTVLAVRPLARGVLLEARSEQGEGVRVEAAYAVACDGCRSTTREHLGVGFPGHAYPGRYAMCDAPDTTNLGPVAGIFLHEDGLVESFPMPGGHRRWVIRCRAEPHDDTSSEVADAVERRTPYTLPPGSGQVSRFVAERRLAARLVVGRIALAGDAAHVVSPIGGQGLNLGWLGAWTLADALAGALTGDPAALARDAHYRRRLANRVARRAELNMWLGRPGAGAARGALIRALSSHALAPRVARLFTMAGLVEPVPSGPRVPLEASS